MGEAAVASDCDLPKVVNPNVFANPCVVAYSEFPRILDGHSRFDDDTTPHLGAEKAKEDPLERAGPREPGLEK